MMNKKIQNNKGYTLLFSVLVSSVVLAVGISILTISKKEFLLASSARESTTAFYAADSGLECAIYSVDNFLDATGQVNVECLKQTLTTDYVSRGSDISLPDIFTFDMKMASPGTKACAIITVNQYYADDPDLGVLPATTTIESRGYNLGWNTGARTCSDPSARRVERALRYTF